MWENVKEIKCSAVGRNKLHVKILTEVDEWSRRLDIE
jgi:hypothetical protein